MGNTGCKIVAAALLSLSLFPLFAGDSRKADELMYMAMSKQGAERAGLLLRAVEESPEDAAIILKLFARSGLDGRGLAEMARRYDVIWKKYPHQPDIVWYGARLFQAAGRWSDILPNLARSNRYFYSNGKDDPERINSIIRLRIALHTLTGDTVNAEEFFEKISKADFAITLCEFYHTSAFRARVSGDLELEKKLRAKYLEMAELNVRTMSEEKEVSYLAGLMAQLLKYKQNEHADLLLKLIESRISNQDILDKVRVLYVINTGDFERAKREISRLKKVQVNRNHLLFTAALNSGMFQTAAEVLKKLPASDRRDCTFQLAAATYDGRVLERMSNDKRFPVQRRAMLKLAAAGILKDTKLYYEARRMLANHKLSVDVLNSIAYTAAELGVDFDEAYSILKRVVSVKPENAAYLDSMAYICYRKRLYAQAEKYINLALARVTPETPPAVILDHAGDIAAAQGNFHKAAMYYKRAIKFGEKDLSFDYRGAKKKLEKLK